MKRRNVILSVLLVIATIAAAIVISNARTSYEITDGAVVFNSNNTVSYLANGGSVHNLNISYDSANNAACLVVSGNGEDPYALLNYNTAGVTSLSANTYKYIVVTEKVPTGASSSATTTEIFYCAGSINVPTGGKSELFNFTKDGTYHSYIIDMSGVSGWTGTIHSLRVDPFTTASVGDTLYLDSVILAKTSAEASTIAAYRTAKANGTVNDSQSQVIFTSSNYNTYLSADEAEGSLNGDVNADGVVNSNDVRDLKRFCVCYSVANFDEEAADVNSDGIISIKDILCLKKGLVGLYDLGNSAGAASCSVAFDATAEKALLTATNSEPYANFSYPAGDEAIYASQFRYAVITYSASKSGTASVLGATSKTPVESAESHTFAVNGDGDFHSVIVDFSGDSGWTGSIGNLKIRFFNSASTGDWMMLDSITFVEKTSDASSIANTREAVANGATFSEYYTLDIKGQTLGQINAAGTYQNIGYSNNNVLYPFSASWPAAGYANGAQDTLVVFANYDNYIKVADCVDLSKYDRVTITYGTDHRFTTTASEFGFFSAPTIYGQQGSKNTANRLLYVPLTPATAQADWTPQRSSSANINSNYVGPLYMSYYMATSDGAVVTDIEFHLRNAEAATVDTLNNSSGSTVYTVSGDGTTITANGVTYPNKLNYTNGVTVGTDDVNRTLRTDKAAATNGGVQGYDFTNKNVGIFYFLWLGEHGTNLYDIQARINNGVPNLTNPTGNDPAWGPLGVHQHFSEPLYGYYFSSDEWVIRRHIEELTNADIDFLFFDVTNGPAYLQNAFKVMQVIHEFNEMGYKPPKVVFYSNNTNSTYTPGSTILNYIWQNVYSQNLYPDTWFYYQGKPVIVGKKAEFQQLSSSVQNFFTFRQSQWPNETTTSDGNAYSVTYKNHKNNYTFYKKNGGWSWMDFTDPAYPNKNPEGTAFESINVSVAQHMGTTSFSDSGIYNKNNHPNGSFLYNQSMNHGRNWNGTDNLDSGDNYKQGYNYQREWNRVHNDTYSGQALKNIPIVLITGWNEWAAGRQPDSNRAANNQVLFVDTATVNYSRDIEMSKGYYFDSYYMQTIDNIRQYKGSAPTLVRDQMKRIDIYGSFDQWNDVTTSYRDATGETTPRNTTGFGNRSYVNTTGRNDIKSAKIVYDTEYIYFYAECASNITPYSQSTPWMKIYIDIDQSNSTGWYGYDYAVNYAATGSNTTSIATYASNGTATVTDRNIAYSVNGKMIMIRVPLSDLGISDYNNISFAFKWVDSNTTIDSMEKLYTDGDQMPHGRLNYVFTNVAN